MQELLARDLDDLVVERAVLDLMLNARHIREIQFVNGLKPGQLTRRLDGEPVGTIIYNAAKRRQERADMSRASHAATAQHVVSRLMRESLVDKTVIAGTESAGAGDPAQPQRASRSAGCRSWTAASRP